MAAVAVDGVLLMSDSLLSKWGFGDGDIPERYLDWLDDREFPHPDDWHGLLRLLVRTRLVPAMPEQVALDNIETIHNPIRLGRLFGRTVGWDGGQAQAELAAINVVVPFAEVYDLQLSGITA